jgi:hypothetical protein
MGMFVRTAELLAITRNAAGRVRAQPGVAVFWLLACLCITPATGVAQDADPPGRIARLSDTEGSVALQPAGVAAWGAAQLNRPVTTGDRLWSDQDSRAELDLGSAAVRLGSSTAFSFFNLDDRAVQMQLTAGTLIVQVRELFPNQLYEIDTPNLAVALLEPGEYRVEVNDAGDTTVVRVSEGRAHVEGGGQSVTLGIQQMARFSGRDTLGYESGPFGVPDDFDAWSAARERGLMNSPSGDYVPEGVPGTQDLDNNGTWELTPDYGYVWAPIVVVADWAPYRFGHWVFIAPWGWTWIDDAAWGFAPYHYGRWVVWNSAWCWVPGPKHLHPVYAPAVVGWVGGPGRRAGTLGANVGWFPLAPHEVYVPPYRVSAGYARAVNLTNTAVSGTQVTSVLQNNAADAHYLNARVGAVTAVPQAVFAAGERVRGRTVPVSTAVLAGTPVAASAPPILPLPQSALGAAGAHAVSHPPVAYLNRPVLVRTVPPRAPAPFERQLSAMQAAGGEVLAPAALARLQPPAAAAPVRVLPRSALTSPAAAAGVAPVPTLAERERALQTSTLSGQSPDYGYRALPQDSAAPRAAPPGTQAQGGTAGAAGRNDRPPPTAVAPGSGGAASGSTARKPSPGAERYRAPPPPPPRATPPPSSHPIPPATPPAHPAPAAAPAHTSSVHADAVR